jgi:hypothetical protein
MQQELEDAVTMFKHSTMAMDHLSPALEFVVLQTGAKMYGKQQRTEIPPLATFAPCLFPGIQAATS